MKPSLTAAGAWLVSGLGLLVLAACSTGGVANPGPAPPVGNVMMEDSGGGGGTSSVDAGPVNGCMTYEDRTAEAGDRTITWIRTVGTVCLKIKKGQSVTWNPQDTNFAAHPLRPLNGTTPTPIVAQPPGTAPYAQAFNATGTFGFICGFHPDMTGAIQVIE